MKWFLVILILVVTDANSQDTSEQKYRDRIITFVDKQAEGLGTELQNNPSEFEQVFAPCRGKGGIKEKGGLDEARKLFLEKLIPRLKAAIENLFQQPYDYFLGRSQSKVSNNANSYAKSGKSRIPEIVAKLCASDPIIQSRKNSPPKANAGKDQTITLPQISISLQGSGSDKDDDPLKFKWEKLTPGDNNLIVSSTDPTDPQSRIEKLQPGVYQYRLWVTDPYGARDSDVVTITINAAPQEPPTADAGNDIFITLPRNKVTLDGSGSDPNYQWTKFTDGGSDHIVSPKDPHSVVEYVEKGVYQYVLTVTNKNGLQAKDMVKVTVNPPENRPPQVTAGPDTTITLPVNSVTLKSSAKDPDDDEISYEWTQRPGSPYCNILSSTSSTTVIDGLKEGVYQFQLKVSDGRGGEARAIVVVTVKAAIPQPPVADAGIDQHSKSSKETVTLLGSGKDKDGTITNYQWTKISGPDSYHFISPTDSQTLVENLVAGDYEFQLEVTDNDGFTGMDTVILKIDAPPPPPVPSWIWIIVGIILLGFSAHRLYVIWWRWKKEKIIVYFMNPEEEKLVDKLMPNSRKTEGYAVGNSSRGKIRTMKKKGLPLRVINISTLVVNTPGVTRTYKYSFRKGVPELQSETRESLNGNFTNLIPVQQTGNERVDETPAFYIITLDEPMLPEFRERLREIGLNILQHVPHDSYIVLVKDQDQLNKLNDHAEFGFIRKINQYSAADTGFLVRKDHLVNAGSPGPVAKWVVDILLHREDDAAAVLEFLDRNNIELIGSYRTTIRIRISPNTELAYKLASNKFIQSIYEYIPPVLHNNIARQLIGIDATVPGESFVAENGDGEIIAVADTGIDRDHPDLKDRIIGAVSWGRKAKNDTSDPHGHGTHVTGSIIGNGNSSAGEIKGMAPGAKVFFQSLLDENEQLCDMGLQLPVLLQQAYDHGARILNVSWGANTESIYSFDAGVMDRFVFEQQEMLMVVSAGNDAVAVKDENGNELVGFGSIGSPATTKNGLTVGASRNQRMNDDPESMAVFSSRGPCKNDRRVKPDIVAPGTHILSTKSNLAPNRNFENFDKNQAYVYLSGTSMATPIVSGAAALVREYYNKKRAWSKPSAALIKATLLNGTKRLGGESSMFGSKIIPNNNQGYGRLDMLNTIPNNKSRFRLEFRDSLQDPSLRFNKTGEKRMFRIQLQEKTWLRICMVYIDNPGFVVQSDLDLIVAHEGTVLKWTGNAGINEKDPFFSTIKKDFTNNVEIIRIDEAEAGTYTIEVVVTTTGQEGSLGFAMVVTTGDLSGELSNVQL